MRTQTKKKAAPAKKKAAPAKAAAKPAKKMAKALNKKAAAPVAEKRSGFMWKLLEKKEAALKAREADAKSGGAHFERIHANGGDVYARFNGPRRKAA